MKKLNVKKLVCFIAMVLIIIIAIVTAAFMMNKPNQTNNSYNTVKKIEDEPQNNFNIVKPSTSKEAGTK